MTRIAPLSLAVAALSLAGNGPAAAQQYQFGWALTRSQGHSSSSAVSTTTVSTQPVEPQKVLINAESTGEPGVYRILDPGQPFFVLERSESSTNNNNSRSSSFSNFSGDAVSVFHNPITP